MRRLRDWLGLGGGSGSGAPSWSGYLCTETCKEHLCSQPREIEHYQHHCRDCGFRWAALPVPAV